MPTVTQTVRPDRKPRKNREIHDTCLILYEKVLAESRKFAIATDREQADKEAKAVLDRADGDNKTNRLAMLRLWLDARQWVADEAARAAKKAQALAEYNALIAPVVDGWKAANDAWTKFVQAENAKGHNGQKAVANAFWSEFAQIEPKVLMPRGTEEFVSELAAKLDDLTFRVGNFVWDHWCTTCGAPVDEIVIPGKKPFWPKQCGPCFHKPTGQDSVVKKSVKRVLEFRLEPLTPEQVEANKKAARELNERNRQAKKQKRREGAEASAEASQAEFCKAKTDGGAKSIRKYEKELREQGSHPEGKGKKKGGKKKGAKAE